MTDLRILISGGGTGGHLFPAIAIGEALQQRDPRINIHYMGSTFGIEAEVLPVRGLPHTLVPIRGIQRSFSFKSLTQNVKLPMRYMKSIGITQSLFHQFAPHIVVGTGGYASAIPLKVAVREQIPILLQEQNSYPGITTRWYASKAKTVCIAFEEAKKYLNRDCDLTGNPIRKGIQNGDRLKAFSTFNLNPEKRTVFLFGGSQGSAALNKVMNKAVEILSKKEIQVLWQTGHWQYQEYRHHDSDMVRVLPFIDHMAEAYALADIIISRAGALTLSEITLCGKPSILVPFPAAAGDHQMKNAQSLIHENAAVMIEESALSATELSHMVMKLFQKKGALQTMATHSTSLGKPDATESIVNHILALANPNV
ncbi:MAG: undecaprenyldiphospho-muramoylpentapeptide beta-N-acetylglucosaminyltransferase [Candidatus Marinimicrobia bacterium]|nr:undecaprenyldiphospho-muramoylpentapeptide beta-N-acetylglucosaminyltransferase [Candidatus Neomarinimicrobiota bacterium]MBL7059365.1 undecaprenyldiphospho-muramoylpentapeptide beta-N-acetylglucosaminyltransferase [Candidatus Neomarinimicrobiota bacterium]